VSKLISICAHSSQFLRCLYFCDDDDEDDDGGGGGGDGDCCVVDMRR